MILNYNMHYADPNYATQQKFQNYDYDRYTVHYGDSYVAYRSFDAWVNDKLDDLFSKNYHFLGKITNPKHSWMEIDRLKYKKPIGYQDAEVSRDESNIYGKRTYATPQFDFLYDYTGSGDRMQVTLDRSSDKTTADILKNGHFEERLDQTHRNSKIYKVKGNLFTVRMTFRPNAEDYTQPLDPEAPQEKVQVTIPTVTVRLRVKNNQVF